MDSRLPKPSGLKRPVFRALVPSDRLGHTNSTIAGVPSLAAVVPNQQRPQLKLPLSATDILNLPINITKKRHASPDMSEKVVRAKIRRSRSATELRPNISENNKFMGKSLDSVPPKLHKSTTSLRTIHSLAVPAKLTAGSNASSRLATVTTQKPAGNFQRSASSIQRPAMTQSTLPAAKRTATIAKNATENKSGSSKPTAAAGPKKIPAYDYKARFLDLQDRFKVIKEKYDLSQEQLNEYGTLNDQLEESQTKLFRCMNQLKHEESNTQCLRQQISSQEIKLECLSKSITEHRETVRRLNADCERLTKENNEMKPELIDLRQKYIDFSAKNEELQSDLLTTQESLFRSNMERKELHNVVMDLRGNIRVFCRIRPPLETEEQKQLCGLQFLDESSLEISSMDTSAGRKLVKHEFGFDQVFHPRSTQEDIFELVSPLIQSALDGYNICIFAYGQTGSGKTFTMDGVPDNIGIIPRTVDLLFDCIRNYKNLGWEYTIQVTFLEIYNEVLYDLLSNEQKDMDIRMVSAKTPTEIYVSNITEVTVDTADDLRALMQVAKSNRATASTVGNERSSRSHAVTRLKLVGTHFGKDETSIGAINLVDLAGSESPKTSVRMEETKKINKSLSELTNVIMALMQRQEHIPYRNSKLTHLLMPCLGGNSKTLMFINVAPFQDCFVESVKSLRFAASVNSCKMNKAKKNKFMNPSANAESISNSSIN